MSTASVNSEISEAAELANIAEVNLDIWSVPVGNEREMLDHYHNKCPAEIDGLKYTLHEHQRVATQAMLDLEKSRKAVCEGGKSFIHTSSGVLAEAFGSGKTMECLALIRLCKTPAFEPILVWDTGRLHTVTAGKLMTPNVIIVGSSVYDQWLNAIASMTNLTVLPISNIHTMRDFKNKAKDDAYINSFDIILIKNGQIAGSFIESDMNADCAGNAVLSQANYNELRATQHIDIVSVFGMLTENVIWSRLIIDDYDTIKLKARHCLPMGRFSWYISATDRPNYCMRSNLSGNAVGTYDRIKDPRLFSIFKIRNDPAFVKKSMTIYKPRFFLHVLRSLQGKVIDALNMTIDNTALIEMLNSDAVSTAAEMVGIKAKSAAEILERILTTKFESYRDAVKMVKRYKAALTVEEADGKLAAESSADATIGTASKKVAVQRLDKMRVKKQVADECYDDILWHPDLRDYLLEQLQKAEEEVSKHSKIIDRVRNNFSNDECSICSLEPEEDVFLMRCCGIAVCSSCVYRGLQMDRSQDMASGLCPNCRTKLRFQDLIALNPSTDLQEMFSIDKITEYLCNNGAVVKEGDAAAADADAARTATASADVDPASRIKNPKIKRLYEIIKNAIDYSKVPLLKPQETAARLRAYSNNADNMGGAILEVERDNKLLLNSNVSVERPAGKPLKVIVFTNYNETIELIHDELPLPSCILHGTHRQMYNQIEEFKNNDVPIMLINSSVHCAGINLQFASDLVFFHKMVNKQFEAQVEGRIQRYGREYSAKIHFLLYKNELREMALVK